MAGLVADRWERDAAISEGHLCLNNLRLNIALKSSLLLKQSFHYRCNTIQLRRFGRRWAISRGRARITVLATDSGTAKSTQGQVLQAGSESDKFVDRYKTLCPKLLRGCRKHFFTLTFATFNCATVN
jgi:hypothetical protein